MSPDLDAKPVPADDRHLSLLLLALTVVTGYRLVIALNSDLTLYVDEAQYWLWAQNLDWGYFSKPPMIALAIWLPTQICGDSEPCIRAAPLIAYPLTTLLVYAAARRLFDGRTALLAGLAFLTMPGISLSSLIISTDVLLFLFWALALYGFVGAVQSGRWTDWMLVGFASGLGLLTKYTMGIFAVSSVLFMILDRNGRRHLITAGPYVAAGIAALMVAPNMLWNIVNDFPTVRHTAHISNLENVALHWSELGEFLGGQFLVFGPLLFPLFVWSLVSRRTPMRSSAALLLVSFSVPFLAIISLQALLGRANANWAAPTYVAASILVSAWLMGPRGDERRLAAAIALAANVAMGLALYHFEQIYRATGVELNARTDGFKRYRGWDRFAAEIGPILRDHPEATLLGDERDILAQLIYYVRPHPFDAVAWNPDGALRSHFQLTTSMQDKRGRDFILVTDREDVESVTRHFGEASLLREVDVEVHSDWRLRARIFLLRDFRGYGHSN